MSSRIRSSLELSRTSVHPDASKLHVPSLERDNNTIKAIRELPKDSKVLLRQTLGLWMATSVLKNLDNSEGFMFASRLLAPSILSSSRSSYDKGIGLSNNPERTDTGRNNAQLVMVASPERDTVLSFKEIRDVTIDLGQIAVDQSMSAFVDHIDKRAHSNTHFQLGKTLARFGGAMALLSRGSVTRTGNPSVVQLGVRDDAQAAVQAISVLQHDLGSYPSAAMVADPYSTMVPFVSRSAPDNAAFNCFETALNAANRKQNEILSTT